MASEIEHLVDMLSCGNTTPQERYQWAHKLVELAHAEGVDAERKAFMSDVLPHCAACIQAWSVGAKYTIDFSATDKKEANA
jgi:hypothetical protein